MDFVRIMYVFTNECAPQVPQQSAYDPNGYNPNIPGYGTAQHTAATQHYQQQQQQQQQVLRLLHSHALYYFSL